MARIGRMRYQEYTLISRLELLECCFIVDEGNDYLSVVCYVGLFDENEITMLNSLLIHGITISTEKKILLVLGDYLDGYGYLSFDIFLCEYRHPACYSTDERYVAYGYAITLERRGYLYLVA